MLYKTDKPIDEVKLNNWLKERLKAANFLHIRKE
jgi:hypothetical protein